MLPKKPRNMHLVRRNLRSACASSSKSLLTAARRPRRRSKRCAIRHAGASPERATRPLDRRTERHDIVTRKRKRGVRNEQYRKLDLGSYPSGGDRNRTVQDVDADQGKADR